MIFPRSQMMCVCVFSPQKKAGFVFHLGAGLSMGPSETMAGSIRVLMVVHDVDDARDIRETCINHHKSSPEKPSSPRETAVRGKRQATALGRGCFSSAPAVEMVELM